MLLPHYETLPFSISVWHFMIVFLVNAEGASVHSLVDEKVNTPDKEALAPFTRSHEADSSLTIIVVGASGNLARSKIFPALFALFYNDQLPEVCKCSNHLKRSLHSFSGISD